MAFHSAAFVAVGAVVAQHSHILRRQVADERLDELPGTEDLEVAPGAPVFFGAIKDVAGARFVEDFVGQFLVDGLAFEQSAQGGVPPEFGQLPPAAGAGDGESVVGPEDPGGDQQVQVGVPREEVPEGLGRGHDAGLAVGDTGAFAHPGAEHLSDGVEQFGEQGAVAPEDGPQ